jgi:alkanesulfonate monooxygenase SsuD/methylene tetrahydromethanopterin reductase-like flavin-dependent oxidoreductase (luciferase family)
MSISISIGISPRESLRDWMRFCGELERGGVSEMWLIDSQLAMKDVYAGLTLAALATESMILGTGVTNLHTRHPTVTANAIAAVAELSGGRAALGLGAGDSAVYGLGRTPSKVAEVREALSFFGEVLEGRAGTWEGREYTLAQSAPAAPVHLAVSQPRMCRLAGELADGAFTNFLPLSGLPQVRAAHRAGEAAAGRPEGSTELVCRFFIIPGDASDPSGPAAIARGMFSAYGSVPVYAAFFRWLGWAERLDPMVAAYEAGDRARAMELAPEELIREIFLFGAVEEIRERLQAFVEGGISTAVLTPICSPQALGEVMEALAP